MTESDSRRPFTAVIDDAIGSLSPEQIESWNEILEEAASGAGHALSEAHRWTPEHRRVVEVSLIDLFLSEGTLDEKVFDVCTWDQELGAAITCWAARRAVRCLDQEIAKKWHATMVLNMCDRHIRRQFQDSREELYSLVTLNLQSVSRGVYLADRSARDDFAAVSSAGDAVDAAWRTWQDQMLLPSLARSASFGISSAAKVLQREEGRNIEPLLAKAIPSSIDAIMEGYEILRLESSSPAR